MKLLTWLLDLLYPPKCVFCGRLLAENETDLCGRCRRELPTAEREIKRGEFFTGCTCVYYYENAVRQSVLRFKFRSMRQYADAYGRLLAMRLLPEREAYDLLTWVPVSAKRRRQRGYDQAELLAERVAAELGLPCERTLQKIRHNPAQSKQSGAAARKANVLGVYRAVRPERIKEKRILLIDDVITTGATLTECSKVLWLAGAKEISCAALAAVRKPDAAGNK